jgi:hypothetical protein
MKKTFFSFLATLFIFTSIHAQSKFNFGLKGGSQYVDPKLYEFRDPFPFYKYDDNITVMYGSTSAISGVVLGIYSQYTLVKSKRIKVNLEAVFNRKGYSQQDLTGGKIGPLLIIKKNYLDIPLSLIVSPFKNSGFFIEPGVNQAFLLSQKTNFPDLTNSSNEFEKRRSRALLRETNLTGFRVGAGWDYKLFNIAAYYQTDKQYEYIQLGIRYSLSKK